ncbi:DUF1566 domain-containing protein [Haloferula sp.]|uniref:Lcl domain-containing protein n=1 Tax=Haloferula sp. TaxID=2497595 RepID=UPI00329E20E2
MRFWPISFLLFISALPAFAAGVLSVTPSTAQPGDTVTVTMTLDDSATPPPPPSQVQPVAMRIGDVSGTAVSRTGNDCTASFTLPALQGAGLYDCVVVFDPPPNDPDLGQLRLTLEDGFSVISTGPVQIFEDPTSRNVVLGGSASFSVVATGFDPKIYQWQKDEVDIPGADSATYTIEDASLSDAADYRCVVINMFSPDGETSAAATLTVLDPSEPLEKPYAIVDTGQTTFYDNSSETSAPAVGADFHGQDATYTGNQPTYLTSDDGKSVYDYHTGLTWTQSPDLNGDGTIDEDDKKTQSDAAAYVATLNAQNFGGFSDWRLPTIKEIYSLMDFRGTDPTSDDETGLVPFIDTDYFDFGYGDTDAMERLIDAQFATSSIYVDTVMNGQTAMFGLNLADGRIKGYGLMNIDFYVLYVRGNTDYGTNDLVDNGDSTVTDQATGLMWQQDDSGQGMLWKESLAYAEGSTHAGYDDWRLPNAKELQSILDYSRSPGTTSSAAMDSVFTATQITNEGGEVDYPWYYTGTTHAQQGGGAVHAVYICFGRSTGYHDGDWKDVHGAGAQRSESKVFDTTGYTYVDDGYYFAEAPQGDSARFYNYVRLVRDAPAGPPTVELSTVDQTVSFDTKNVAISGTHNDEVAMVSWVNELTGSNGVLYVAGNNTISINSVPLDFGDNVITVTVTSPGGDTAEASVTITRSSSYDGSVIYVDADTPEAAVSQNGRAWDTAFRDLQDALAVATAGQEIWVAEGVYYPDEAVAGYGSVTEDSIGSYFQLIEDVSVYGGFDGTEVLRSERDWEQHVTILSGDIDQDDTKVDDVVITKPETNINGFNARTVVISVRKNRTLLDGVTVTAGSGGDVGGFSGGGTLRRCVIQGNHGVITGGVQHESSQEGDALKLIECDVLANTGSNIGGVSAYGLPDFILTSCRVQGNRATTTSGSLSVGGVSLGDNDAILTNCVVSGNVGYLNGGVVMQDSGQMNVYNSTIASNYAREESDTKTTGGISAESEATFYIYNSIIWDNDSPQNKNVHGITYRENAQFEGEPAIGSGSLDGTDEENIPLFLLPIKPTATATTDGDFRLDGSSAGIGDGDDFSLEPDTSDVDEDGDFDEDLPLDLIGNPRVNGTMDLGAYEYDGPTMVNPITKAFEVEEGNQNYIELVDFNEVFAESGLSFTITGMTPAVINPQLIDSVFYASAYEKAGRSATVEMFASDANGNEHSFSITVDIVDDRDPVESFRYTYGMARDWSEDDEDFSGNGIPNLLYFAFNLGDPSGTEITYADPENGTMGLPTFKPAAEPDTWEFSYVRYRHYGITDHGYRAEFSTNMDTWINAGNLEGGLISTTVTPIDDNYEFVTLKLQLNLAEKAFLRVNVYEDM